MANLNQQVKSATKWSAITEIFAKLVTPISTVVLARLLTPEAFGVMVTATMVISFAELFTDAGFQKYLVQKKFETEDDLFKSTTVAFWSNLSMSLLIWFFIVIFSSDIAKLVGNEGYGHVVAISCICIPVAAFSSIQTALFKRFLDFKSLFFRRIVVLAIPLLITIPIAFFTHSYWALIIGMIVRDIANAVILTVMSKWKPNFFYDWQLFKQMFAFTAWSMVEAISIWLTSYLDVFIVGTMLSTYYMGIYRTSINTVGQFMSVITAATTPVLFSSLSKLQDDREEFKNMFFKFQKLVGLLVIPIGTGIFLFSNTITDILLGDQWQEASYFIGWWGLTSCLTIVLSYYCSEVYRSLGKPKLSVIAQWLHLVVLIPLVYYAAGEGFRELCLFRSLVRFELIFVNVIILYFLTKIKITQLVGNIKVPLIGALGMVLCKIILPNSNSIICGIVYIALCALVYCMIVLSFTNERTLLLNFIKKKRK